MQSQLQHDPEAGHKLQELLGASAKLPFPVTLFVAGAIFFDLIAIRHVRLWVLVLAGMLFGVSWFSSWWYRKHPDSLQAIFAMYSVGTISVAAGLLWVVWAARVVGRAQWLYEDYVWAYLTIFSVILVVMTLIFIKRWRYLHELFQDLRAHLEQGTIPDYRLYYWLSYRGAQGKWPKAWMAAIIGVAVTSTMLIGGFGGRDILGYFLFLVLLVGSPTAVAVIVARLWLQRKYLQGQDLRVVYLR